MQNLNRRTAIITICCVAGFTSPARATEKASTTKKPVTYTCPAEYPAASLTFANSPPGWTPMVQHNLTLRAAGIAEGPMESRGMLVPIHRSYKNRKEDMFTHLGGSTTKNKYVWCGYGGWNDILLYRPLDESISQCVVTYVPEPGIDEYQVKDILCQ